jgi:gas vesicle protein
MAKLPKAQIEKRNNYIVELYKSGLTPTQIRDKIKSNGNTIKKVINDYNNSLKTMNQIESYVNSNHDLLVKTTQDAVNEYQSKLYSSLDKVLLDSIAQIQQRIDTGLIGDSALVATAMNLLRMRLDK